MSDKTAFKEAGAEFRALRRKLKWTQQALCARAQVSRDTLHRFEKGNPIQLESLVALLGALRYRLAFVPRQEVRAADMRKRFAHLHEDTE